MSFFGYGMPRHDHTFDMPFTERNGTKIYQIFKRSLPMMYSEFFDHLKMDERFREQFTRTLVDCKYYFYRWEMAPVAQSTAQTIPVKFAVTEWNMRDQVYADHSHFKQHFGWHIQNANVTSFANLSSDATLIAPLPMDNRNYSNLSNFLRNAPSQQIHDLWKKVASTMLSDLKRTAQPLWLSTTVGGIPWLHVRIDSRPKYYHFAEFKVYHNTYTNALEPNANNTRRNQALTPVCSANNGASGFPEPKDFFERNENPSFLRSVKSNYHTIEDYEQHGDILIYNFSYRSKPVMFEEALFRLQYDKTFRELLIDVFQGSNHHDSFVWEVVPITRKTLANTKFSFVLISKVSDQIDYQLENDIKTKSQRQNSGSIVGIERSQCVFVASTAKRWNGFSQFMNNEQTSNLHGFWKAFAKRSLEEIDANETARIWLSSSKVKGSHWTYARISKSCERIVYRAYR